MSPLSTFLDDRVAALELPTLNTQTGTSYTTVGTDSGKLVGMNNAAANTLNIATGIHATGTQIMVRQLGAGQTTITCSGGTINSRGGALKLMGQYAYALVTCVAANTFEVTGDLTT